MSNTSMIFSDRLSINVGARVLFDTDISIKSDDKICIMGLNGCGKTTLLNMIYDRLFTTLSEQIIYIRQDIIIPDTNDDILTFVLKADIELYDNNLRYVYLTSLERDMTDEEETELSELNEKLSNGIWEKYFAKANKVLNGLQINNLDRKMVSLSGGWKTRVSLAKALLIEPKLLLLDEPTNHLDLNGVLWLRDYLAEYKKTLVVISHMKSFVDYFTNQIWFIHDIDNMGQKIYKINGSVKQLNKTLEQMQTEITKKWDKYLKQIKDLQKKSTPKTQLDDFIKKNYVPEPTFRQKNHFIFSDNINYLSGKNIISLDNISFKYPNTSRSLFKNINLCINTSSRYILVGDNGIGKTTLFKLLKGELEPTKGTIIKDSRVNVSIYLQDIISSLELDKTPISFLSEKYNLSIEQCRANLGRVGIKKYTQIDKTITNGKNKAEIFDPCSISIEQLSGGYKARLAFCSIILEDPDILLLDEPTNHLDAETINDLIHGLNNFKGGIVVITHDLDFIQDLDDCQIIKLSNKSLQHYPDIDEYINSIDI